ncbi:hypothetical protein [Pseudomonas poae]|nr:hypothetical protein [Pseudomonas poae]
MSTPSSLPERISVSKTLPKTIQGIKKRAKKICLPGQKHAEALNTVARELGYRDYHQAQQKLASGAALPETVEQRSRHSVFLSAYWRDTDTKPRSGGCETLEVFLPRPLNTFVSKHQVTHARNLEGFRQEAPDHLEMISNASSQARAWELLVRAALTLQFIEVSGLRPATSQKQFQALELLTGLPSKDHISLWIDPASGMWFALDEPYGHVNELSMVERRAVWITKSSLHLNKPEWAGLYYPGNAVPHLISPAENLLGKIAAILEGLSPIAVVPSGEQRWAGISEPYNSRFTSPAKQASGVARRARPGTTYGFSKGAVEYHREAGYSPLWRPEIPLSQEDHKRVGAELQCLMISPMPFKTYQKIRTWCSTLENWMYAEYRDGGRDQDFYSTYYGGEPSAYPTASEQLSALKRIRTIVVNGYAECKPRRDLLNDLSIVTAFIEGQAT